MRVKRAKEDDVKKVAEIEYLSGYKWSQNKKKTFQMIKKVFKEKYCEIYVLEDKEPIGYFAISFDKKKSLGYLNYFAINKKYQGLGLSKKMIKKVINIFKIKECEAIELAVWGKNFPAITLYSKFGFYVTEITRNKYPNGDSKLRMRKDLK